MNALSDQAVAERSTSADSRFPGGARRLNNLIAKMSYSGLSLDTLFKNREAFKPTSKVSEGDVLVPTQHGFEDGDAHSVETPQSLKGPLRRFLASFFPKAGNSSPQNLIASAFQAGNNFLKSSLELANNVFG